MDDVEKILSDWRAGLTTTIPIGGLISRNPIAHRWKAPLRCFLLREAALWRFTDLLTQSHALHRQEHGLGARILLRSGLETLATLIYLNQLIQLVVDGELSFQLFSKKTSTLLLGSRDGSTNHQSLNIVTILTKCDKRYPGLKKLFEVLSESAHPNYEGMMIGYSDVDHDEFETRFSNRWMQIYGKSHFESMKLCLMIFDHEYNDIWPDLLEKLEIWIVENNSSLEATNTAVVKD